jgi:peptide/nickel transport system substrate-binding protein
VLKQDEWKPGEKIVFLKNTHYKPRAEPMSGLAGGKVVTLDRVEWLAMPDSQTQVNALLNGEIDMIGSLDFDNLPLLEKNKDVKVLKATSPGQFVFRPNWLQPPFNDVRIRRAAAYALSQPEFLQANIGDSRFYKTCKALYTCDTALASNVGMDGLIDGNIAKAKELLAEAKYDGTVVVMPQPTDLGVIKQIAPVAKAQLEKAGFKVEVQPMDWQSMVTRLISKKGPPSEGGWNAYGTSWSQIDILDPLMTPNLAATCDKARAGWPCDEALEKLRDDFVRAETPELKKKAADAVQVRAMEVVTHVPLGEWYGVWAVRSNVEVPAKQAPVEVFWGMNKK